MMDFNRPCLPPCAIETSSEHQCRSKYVCLAMTIRVQVPFQWRPAAPVRPAPAPFAKIYLLMPEPVSKNPAPPVSPSAPLSFEAGLLQLEGIVKEMESGELPLERAIELFENGMKLSDACRKQLEEAETRVEILMKRAGEVTPQPFRTDKT